MFKFYLTSLLVFISGLALQAQVRCATEEFDIIRRQNNPQLETKDQFEKWMSSRIKKSNTSNLRTEATQTTYTIPIVVHIIHNGEPVGTGTNISDAQVLSQIKVLNNDFQRLNADATQTPAEFTSVAGSMSIEFVLAKQDPLGNATTGIVRINGKKSNWNLYQDAELKGKSYWPAEQYFNIWVTNFPDYLGYTQFPVSNLPGITDSSQDRLTDGIIVHYRSFGSVDDGAFDLESQYDKGRTLTHETGHFFGLRHIWGDVNSCSGTDYVADTPPQIGSTLNCPTHPVVQCSSLAKMFQNYLDYTDDHCMNIFSKGQVDRMATVLQNSPRRASLLTSPGAFPPGTLSLDLGILSVETPTTLECSGSHTPTITIRNFGTTSISQASIELKINGTISETKSVNLLLNPLTQTQVSFNNYVSLSGNTRNFQFTILSTNGIADENAINNIVAVTTKTAQESVTPFFENFESGISNWTIVNPDALTTWSITSLPNSGGKAMVIENYSYQEEGALDGLMSPAFDVSNAPALLLKFKLAYAQDPGVIGDALSVYVFNDCTYDVANATRVFLKEGSTLATTSSTSNHFVPASEDWISQTIPLSSFTGNSHLRFGFISRNGWGNSIYIDDIELVTESVNNLSIQNVIEPSLAVCKNIISPKLKIANHGTELISSLTVTTTKNGIALPSQTISQTLNPGEESEIEISSIPLLPGTNTISIQIIPNGMMDAQLDDNTITIPITLIQNSGIIPARENFNNGNSWSIINTGSQGWTTTQTNYTPFGFSAVFNAYNNTTIGDQSWLVSPKLDFSKAIEASMFADFSYGYRSPNNEFITIAASKDCGTTFSSVFYSSNASNLTGTTSALQWNPSSKNDWVNKYFNMDELAGEAEVLIAIQATNFNGNNLYVDNIEFYENDDPNPFKITEPFLIYSASGTTRLTFNLEDYQTVEIQVADITGNLITDVTQDNTLNQTVTFQLGNAPAIYIFKVRIGSNLYIVKQYMAN